ncbi:MAG: ABC transporter permease [Lachnospiraceae bacterium]|nr:ABC transporter permease [Lachnospiraceae bacterium]
MVRGKLRIAFGELLREKNYGGNILLEGVALLLIGVLIFFQALNDYNENETDKILKYGVKYTGVVVNDSCDNLEDLERFENEIRNIKGIGQVGSAGQGSFNTEDFKDNVFDEIYEIQKGHRDIFGDLQEEEFGNVIESVNLVEGSEKLFNLGVSKGYKFDQCNSLLNDYDEVIYLGSKISKMKIGTVIYDLINGKAVIGGYLEPNLRMVRDEISDEAAAYMNMDYKVLIVRKDELKNRSNIIFAINNDSDMNTIKEEIYQLARMYKVDMTVKTYRGIFDGIASSKKALINLLERILSVVLVTSIILQICMQSTHIIENFRNYGILYANGFSTADQFFIFAVQSLVKGIIAMSLALGAGYFLMDVFYSNEVYSLDVLYDVVLKYVLWKVGICAVIIAILSVLISIVAFKGKTPKELVQER